MKFRSLFLGVMATAAVSAATLETGNTYGIIKLPVSTQNVMVAVPWVSCTDAAQNVTVDKLVLTKGLKSGDKLVINVNGTYKGWSLDADDGAWQPMASVTTVGSIEANPPNAETLARGQGFFLIRSVSTAVDLYLYGQLATTTSQEVSATAAAGTYTLLSNPTDSAKAISTFAAAGTQGDKIIVFAEGGNGQLEYSRDSTGWKMKTTESKFGATVTKWVACTATIAPGAGFWYYNAGNAAKNMAW